MRFHDNRQAHVRAFAAQAISYFVRKLAQRGYSSGGGNTELSATLDAMFALAADAGGASTPAAAGELAGNGGGGDGDGGGGGGEPQPMTPRELQHRRFVQEIKFMHKPAVVKILKEKGLDTRGKHGALKARLLRAVSAEHFGTAAGSAAGSSTDGDAGGSAARLEDEDATAVEAGSAGGAQRPQKRRRKKRRAAGGGGGGGGTADVTKLSTADSLQDGFAAILFEVIKGVGHGEALRHRLSAVLPLSF
eukprot:SAG22_NODE_611_length_8586_cov_8.288795_5_plen_248_part_00